MFQILHPHLHQHLVKRQILLKKLNPRNLPVLETQTTPVSYPTSSYIELRKVVPRGYQISYGKNSNTVEQRVWWPFGILQYHMYKLRPDTRL